MTARPLIQPVIGILGGASNVATEHYYRKINQLANQRLGGWDIAETLIAGMNFGNIEYCIRHNQWQILQDYVGGHLARLAAARVDLVICASNTLHRFLPPLLAQHPLPFLHIADPTAAAIKARGLDRIALFGTAPIMQMSYMRERYEQVFGIQIVVPSEQEIAEIDRIIFDQLVKDQVLAESRKRYLQIAERLRNEQGAQGLIMGCTEIAMLISQADQPDLPMFDTTALHCAAAVDWVSRELPAA
ncbi:MAG: amino acid racemase [Xanthomonadales bacterium]|nr:amino acid racemase [Xanthomonadales bacterium]